MNSRVPPKNTIKTPFANLNAMIEGFERKELYLLEYTDPYLKDSFLTQLAEHFVAQVLGRLILHQNTEIHSLNDIITSRTFFTENPHDFPSVKEIIQQKDILSPEDIIQDYKPPLSPYSISPKSTGLLKIVYDFSSQKDFIMIDTHASQFLNMLSGIVPLLKRIAFQNDITIILTHQINSNKDYTNEILYRMRLYSSLFIYSELPLIFTKADEKYIAVEFQLYVKPKNNKLLSTPFTIRPASGYCQEG